MSLTSKLAGQPAQVGPSALSRSWGILAASRVRGHGSCALTSHPTRADIGTMTAPDLPHDPFDLIRRLGTNAFEVEGLPVPVLYVRDRDLAFIRAGLTPEARTRAADWLLSTVAAQVPQT